MNKKPTPDKPSSTDAKVTLISYSKPAEAIKGIETIHDLTITTDMNNIKDLIAFSARVSNPTNQHHNKTTSDRLIDYLAKHKHWSPFEMVSVCLEIETTRDIARQILRHRSFSFQEFSQRYANPKEFGEQFVLRDARLQDPKNRQNSVETNDETLQDQWKIQQKRVIASARDAYNWAIDKGIAKEQARVVLPEGNTKSRLHMNGTIRSWIHYMELRRDNGTQQEHRDIAEKIALVIGKIFPINND